jgi:hypothetical protein
MRTKIVLTLSGILAVLLAGCASDPKIPAELQYYAPQPGPNTASITGSEVPSPLTHNQTAFVLSVDGKVVVAGKKGWNVPLVVEAGPRIIDVQMSRGDFVSHSYLELAAVPGARYVLMFASDVGLVGNNTYCDFWFIDAATLKPVTPRQRGAIEGGGR